MLFCVILFNYCYITSNETVQFMQLSPRSNISRKTAVNSDVVFRFSRFKGNTAGISLYSLNGKRVLRTKADASKGAKNISSPNLVAGVYLLSVKGVNGHHGSSIRDGRCVFT